MRMAKEEANWREGRVKGCPDRGEVQVTLDTLNLQLTGEWHYAFVD